MVRCRHFRNVLFNAINALVPIITAAPVDEARRETWLERLFDAYQNDGIPYIEALDDYWGASAEGFPKRFAFRKSLRGRRRPNPSIVRCRPRRPHSYRRLGSMCSCSTRTTSINSAATTR